MRDRINMVYFILEDVVWSGVPLADLLVDRMQHGVAVNIIYDAFGSAETSTVFFDRMRQAGAAPDGNRINTTTARFW